MPTEIDIVFPHLQLTTFSYGWNYLDSIGFNPAGILLRILSAMSEGDDEDDFLRETIAMIEIYMDHVSSDYRSGSLSASRYLRARYIAEIASLDMTSPGDLLAPFINAVWSNFAMDVVKGLSLHYGSARITTNTSDYFIVTVGIQNPIRQDGYVKAFGAVDEYVRHITPHRNRLSNGTRCTF